MWAIAAVVSVVSDRPRGQRTGPWVIWTTRVDAPVPGTTRNHRYRAAVPGLGCSGRGRNQRLHQVAAVTSKRSYLVQRQLIRWTVRRVRRREGAAESADGGHLQRCSRPDPGPLGAGDLPGPQGRRDDRQRGHHAGASKAGRSWQGRASGSRNPAPRSGTGGQSRHTSPPRPDTREEAAPGRGGVCCAPNLVFNESPAGQDVAPFG